MQQVKAVCINRDKGPKNETEIISLTEDFGVNGDFHAVQGSLRQVSILLESEILKARKLGLNVSNGAFGENIIVSGIEISEVSVGDIFKIAEDAELEVTIIGKECSIPCNIQKVTGKCIMPETGIFCKVLKGGVIKNGDRVGHSKR